MSVDRRDRWLLGAIFLTAFWGGVLGFLFVFGAKISLEDVKNFQTLISALIAGSGGLTLASIQFFKMRSDERSAMRKLRADNSAHLDRLENDRREKETNRANFTLSVEARAEALAASLARVCLALIAADESDIRPIWDELGESRMVKSIERAEDTLSSLWDMLPDCTPSRVRQMSRKLHRLESVIHAARDVTSIFAKSEEKAEGGVTKCDISCLYVIAHAHRVNQNWPIEPVKYLREESIEIFRRQATSRRLPQMVRVSADA